METNEQQTETNSSEWGRDYSDAVAEFLEAAGEWLGPVERPLVVQLRALAGSLDSMMRSDGAVQSAAASQFAATWARLAKRDPKAGKGSSSSDDGLDFLEPIPGLERGLAHGHGCRCPECTG